MFMIYTLLLTLLLLLLSDAAVHTRHIRHISRPEDQLEMTYVLENDDKLNEQFQRSTRYDRRCFFTPVNCVVYFKDDTTGGDIAKHGTFPVSDRSEGTRKRRRNLRNRLRHLL